MTKMMAAAVVALLFAGSVLTASLHGRRQATTQGLMPEVAVTAEMPRLVMPTVEVHAFRTVAASGTAGNVY